MSKLYLYHATDKKNLESIRKSGLLIDPPSHTFAEEIGVAALKGKIFLALTADAAEAYVECADEDIDEIVILKVTLDSLDEKEIGYDWNNRCEYSEDINSCIYKKDIPFNLLKVCDPDNEPNQNIHTFKGTIMYENVLNTFDEECETNKEILDY